ncbi:hypothetical protein NESM_000912100 [Novymonas esmeraldas]|uniref:Uncharacterized protein n=1 Tax=Novymonas esmeraldas TaxID=1808958 RepID=A0AAW0F0Y6_9TRYP
MSVAADEDKSRAAVARTVPLRLLLRRLHRGLRDPRPVPQVLRQKVTALERLLPHTEDPLAHVTSYSPSPIPLALTAAHARARVYAELRGTSTRSGGRARLEMDSTQPTLAVTPVHGRTCVDWLLRLTWWVQLCGCAVCLRLDQCDGGAVPCGLPLFQHVASLSVTQNTQLLHADGRALRSLEKLTIDSDSFHGLCAAGEAFGALRELHLNPFLLAHRSSLSALPLLADLHIHGNMGTLDVSVLACAAGLRSLHVGSESLLRISGLSKCTALSSCSIRSAALPGLDFLAEATALRKAVVVWSGIRSVGGLAACTELDSVSLLWCHNLNSLAPLEAASKLTRINASGSGLTTVVGLGRCPSLEELDLTNCEGVVDLTPLNAAPQLRRLSISGTGVRRVDALRTCPLLEELDVSWCTDLADLSPLRGSAKLRTLLAGCSSVSTVAGLNRCGLLQHVDVSHCAQLASLSALAGAPSLETLKARCSAVRDVTGLETCRALKLLDVRGCAQLPMIHGSLAALLP